jgi:hypothetical protein
MKKYIGCLVLIFSSIGFSKPCGEQVEAYNLNYASQKEASEARKLFKGSFSKFLKDNTTDDNKNLAYYFSTRLFHPQSNDDNLFDLSEVFQTGKPLKPDDDGVVRGHTLINLESFKEEKDIQEIAKFLYIQLMTNADLKRASKNLNDLTDCAQWHIFK